MLKRSSKKLSLGKKKSTPAVLKSKVVEEVAKVSNSPIIERGKEVLTFANSKDSVNFGAVLKRAMEIQNSCDDFIVPTSKILVGDDIKLHIDTTHAKELNFTDHSFGQLCTKIGVPTQYMKKCAEQNNLELNRLVKENINTWLRNLDTKELLIRQYKDNARGILSNKYSIMDTTDIIRQLGEVIDFDDYDLNGYLVNPERLHLRLTHKENLNIKKDDLFAGIQIDSSDVGRNTLKVQFFIYKQVCTNGLVIPKLGGTLFSQKHVGISHDDFKSKLSKSFDRLPDLVATSERVIKSSKGLEHSKQEILEEIAPKISKDIKGSNDIIVPRIVELTDKKYGRSNWGIVNALTELAQDYTLDRRIEIEAYASEWLVS